METKIPVRGCSVKEYSQSLGWSEATGWRRVKDGTLIVARIAGRTVVNIDATNAKIFGEREAV